MNWAIDGTAFYEILMILKNRYGNPPVFVTENGGAFLDIPGGDGRVEDYDRIAYYRDYLGNLLRFARAKGPIFGGICLGRFWTILSGRTAMGGASALSM